MLAEGTALPPLVQDLKHRLAENGWKTDSASRYRARSRSARRPRASQLSIGSPCWIRGFARTGGTDLLARRPVEGLGALADSWSPDFDATAIEAARYGPTLAEATAARLLEAAAAIERNARRPPFSCSMPPSPGSTRWLASFQVELEELIRDDGNFLAVTGAGPSALSLSL